MATITSLLQPARGEGNPSRKPYMVELTIDLTAQAIDCSSGDVVQALTVPANTVILWAGVQVTESATQDTGTDATVILGTAVDDNEYVAAFDIDGASDLAYAPTVAQAGVLVSAVADTLDLTFAGSGATFSAGKLRVFALLAQVGLLGDKAASEVDRDLLA
jgi:hypothetical protein|tara:strand:+ start:2281 stop:2763 length:483 start_codon:yes stop_codon:yes gene_type:complete